MAKKVIIFGASTLAEMLFDLSKSSHLEIIGVVDDSGAPTGNLKSIYLGKFEDVSKNGSDYDWLVAIGENKNRRKIADRLASYDFSLTNFIHELAYVSSISNVGFGNIIFPFAYIGNNVSIGNGNIFMPHVNLSHDVVVSNYCFFGPSVSIAGFCEINQYSKFKTGSKLYAHSRTFEGEEVR